MINCCGGMVAAMFPFKYDVYIATAAQNQYGELERTWTFQGKYICNLENIQGERLDPIINSKYEPDADLVSPTLLITPGRVLQEIFVTNIVDRSGSKLWFEPHNGINNNTIFEVRSYVPAVDVRGKLSHYKYKIVRAQQQLVDVA